MSVFHHLSELTPICLLSARLLLMTDILSFASDLASLVKLVQELRIISKRLKSFSKLKDLICSLLGKALHASIVNV